MLKLGLGGHTGCGVSNFCDSPWPEGDCHVLLCGQPVFFWPGCGAGFVSPGCRQVVVFLGVCLFGPFEGRSAGGHLSLGLGVSMFDTFWTVSISGPLVRAMEETL